MNPHSITVYDPAMCCSTGVCGPEVDPKLARFSADLEWLAAQGVTVRRFNLAQEPGAFAADAAAKGALERAGDSALPLIKAGDAVVSSGEYPTRDALAAWAGLESTPSLYTEAVAELVAIGAAIASNCEPCFKFHYDKARRLGVSRGDILRAVETAQAVREAPARAVLDLAHRYLERGAEAQDDAAPAAKTGCCGPAKTETSVPRDEVASAAELGCCGPGTAPAATKKKSGCC
ncbi:MAG: arsenite efflux transporter metallochaperone ArsD [Polyangiaceae bacterium]|nr:arsenite efflux transporter metallochaperone ArsD [Polyangiaceae bacterium]